jgi:hypothetical protein
LYIFKSGVSGSILDSGSRQDLFGDFAAATICISSNSVVSVQKSFLILEPEWSIWDLFSFPLAFLGFAMIVLIYVTMVQCGVVKYKGDNPESCCFKFNARRRRLFSTRLFQVLKTVFNIVDGVTDIALAVSVLLISVDIYQVVIRQDGINKFAYMRLLRYDDSNVTSTVPQFVSYNFSSSSCSAAGDLLIGNADFNQNKWYINPPSWIRSPYKRMFEVSLDCENGDVDFAFTTENGVPLPCYHSALSLQSKGDAYFCTLNNFWFYNFITMLLFVSLLAKEFLIYAYYDFLPYNLNEVDVRLMSGYCMLGNVLYLSLATKKRQDDNSKADCRDTRFVPGKSDKDMIQMFPILTTIWGILDLLTRISSSTLAVVLLSKNGKNWLGYVTLITSSLGFLRYFWAWTNKLKFLIFVKKGFEVKRAEHEQLRQMDYRLSVVDQLPSYAALTINYYEYVEAFYEPILNNYVPPYQGGRICSVRTAKRWLNFFNFALLVVLAVFCLLYFRGNKVYQIYFIGGVVLAVVFLQAFSFAVKRIVGHRFYAQLMKVDLVQAIINPESCLDVCNRGTKWAFLVDNVFRTANVKRPRISLHQADIALRIVLIVIMIVFVDNISNGSFTIAVLFAFYIVYFLYISFLPPRLDPETTTKKQVSPHHLARFF